MEVECGVVKSSNFLYILNEIAVFYAFHSILIAFIYSLNWHTFSKFSFDFITVDVQWVETEVVDEGVVLEEGVGVDVGVGVGVGVAEVMVRSYQPKI